MKTAVVLLIVLLACSADAQDASSGARTRMASTKIFGGVGIAGVTSEGELLFDQIMSQPQPAALKDFDALYADGNPQAQAYALAGIRKLDRQRLKVLLQSAEDSSAWVETMRGCIVQREPLKTVARHLDAARYDFWLYREPRKTRPPGSSAGSVGGYNRK